MNRRASPGLRRPSGRWTPGCGSCDWPASLPRKCMRPAFPERSYRRAFSFRDCCSAGPSGLCAHKSAIQGPCPSPSYANATVQLSRTSVLRGRAVNRTGDCLLISTMMDTSFELTGMATFSSASPGGRKTAWGRHGHGAAPRCTRLRISPAGCQYRTAGIPPGPCRRLHRW
jgi:hypothetical protein